MAHRAPGWYDDERGALRWWDGRQWTEHVQLSDDELPLDGPGDPAPPQDADAFAGGGHPSGAFISATEPGSSRLWLVWVLIGIVLLGAVVVATVLIPIAMGVLGAPAPVVGGFSG